MATQKSRNSETTRRLVLDHIVRQPQSLVSEILADVQNDVSYSLEEKDIKAALKYLTRNGFIETENQGSRIDGKFGGCTRRVLKRF